MIFRELIGYIVEMNAAQEVEKIKKYKLLKFVLSNASQRKIVVLIWGDELINKYSSELQILRVNFCIINFTNFIIIILIYVIVTL